MIKPNVEGILLVDKPKGITSAGVISKLKRFLNLPKSVKIGHAGTLDPMATGLLVCLIGTTTRLSAIYSGADKTYEGNIIIGLTTDTDDIEGNVVSRSEGFSITFSQIEEVARSFIGEIMQSPPLISAVKINGQRAYKRARAGEVFEVKPRKVKLHQLQVYPAANSFEFSFKATVSSGFYIRSLAREIGEKLGVGATLSGLRRTRSGVLSVDNAYSLDYLEFNAYNAKLYDWEQALHKLPRLSLTREQLLALKKGDFTRSQPALEVAGSSYYDQHNIFRFGSLSNSYSDGVVERIAALKWKVIYWNPVLRNAIEMRSSIENLGIDRLEEGVNI